MKKQIIFICLTVLSCNVFAGIAEVGQLHTEGTEVNWLDVGKFEYTSLVKKNKYRSVFDAENGVVTTYIDDKKYIEHKYYPKTKRHPLSGEIELPIYNLNSYSTYSKRSCGGLWHNLDQIMGVYQRAIENGASEEILDHLADACNEAFMQLIFCMIK
ncbi:hypothetical protein [Marinicella rhabdoformis]|uniref:hypothetical protein n=1 Tax=Marinicella rhabdoformis TaxID=2580566 RepID=UPI0012AEB7BE|nr:hypothetical protein [Marinicella rhabdoformis]